MLKKTIKYTDYEGVERTEDFYFNLSKAELTVMNLSEPGGIVKKLMKMSQEMDAPGLIGVISNLILKSYGEISSDGRRFIKSEEMSKNFEQTEAYSELFMELCTDAEATANFITEIIPASMREQIKKAEKDSGS